MYIYWYVELMYIDINLMSISFIYSVTLIYLIVTDDSLKENRSWLMMLFQMMLLMVYYYLGKMPMMLMSDLFWYTLMMHIGFVLHVLILDSMFVWCWKNKYDYMAFMMSRMSFTLSLTGMLNMLRLMNAKWSSLFTASFLNVHSHYPFLNYNYFTTIFNLIYFMILGVMLYTWRMSSNFIDFISIILLNNIYWFNIYAMLLIGKDKVIFNKYSSLNFLVAFLSLLGMSMILDLRLLFWLFFFVLFGLFDIVVYDMRPALNKGYGIWRLNELELIYEKPYHPLFAFGLLSFVVNPYNMSIKLNSSELKWIPDEFLSEEKNFDGRFGVLFDKFISEFPMPMNNVYTYCSSEDLVYGYAVLLFRHLDFCAIDNNFSSKINMMFIISTFWDVDYKVMFNKFPDLELTQLELVEYHKLFLLWHKKNNKFKNN